MQATNVPNQLEKVERWRNATHIHTPPTQLRIQFRQTQPRPNLGLMPPLLRTWQSGLVVALDNLVLVRVVEFLLVRRVSRPVAVIVPPELVV